MLVLALPVTEHRLTRAPLALQVFKEGLSPSLRCLQFPEVLELGLLCLQLDLQVRQRPEPERTRTDQDRVW